MVMGVAATVLSVLLFKPSASKEPTVIRNYETIVQSGTLKAVTEYNSISYHASGDSASGFHYELLQAFTIDKGLQLDITPEMSFEKRFRYMTEGTYDILANSVVVTTELKDSMLFTHPIVENKLVLVQRRPQNNEDSGYIHNQLELANKTLHVVKNSPVILRIRNLSNEIGDTIYIQEVEKYGQEHLLAMVAHGDIDYAVCDESIAKASIGELPQLDIQTAISFTQFYSWGVNKQNTELLDTLNLWLETYKQTKEFKKLKRKYYKN